MNQSTAHEHAPTRPGTLAGTVLCRLVVPAWILAGAAFKLWERNPQLLPKPVTDVTDFVFVRTLGIPRESYLEPAMRRPNLTVVTQAMTRRLMLEGRRCVGVVYQRHGREIEARAGREVILSAGGVSSPQILELSGIGNPAILKQHGIEVRHALPAVGENRINGMN